MQVPLGDSEQAGLVEYLSLPGEITPRPVVTRCSRLVFFTRENASRGTLVGCGGDHGSSTDCWDPSCQHCCSLLDKLCLLIPILALLVGSNFQNCCRLALFVDFYISTLC